MNGKGGVYYYTEGTGVIGGAPQEIGILDDSELNELEDEMLVAVVLGAMSSRLIYLRNSWIVFAATPDVSSKR